MFDIFKNNEPLEKYILSALKENQNNSEEAFKTIQRKYPFFSTYTLRQIISEVLDKKIKKEKIGGQWIKIKSKWKLVSDHINFMGPEVPTKQGDGNTGANLGTYSTTKLTSPEDTIKEQEPVLNLTNDKGKEVNEEDNSDSEQIMYEDAFEYVRDSDNNLSVEEINKIVIDELQKNGVDISKVKERQN